LPRNQTAVIQRENSLSLFHEYFGHGLFCEQSLVGQELVKLEQRLLDEEKQYFNGRKFNLEDIKRFRIKNKTFQKLDSFNKQNLAQYELFAIWTEFLLSKRFGLEKIFENKYNEFFSKNGEAINHIINFNKQYGDLATFYAGGLARRTTPKRVEGLLRDIYGGRMKDVKLALLYGSRKEFSDIDVYIVSDSLPEVKTNWLDIRVEKNTEFERKVKFLDSSLVCPLFDAEYIIGDKEYFEKMKNKFRVSPITKEAIRYNLEKSKEQKVMAMRYPEKSEERMQGLAYSQSYLGNVIALKQGKRKLTKESILSRVNKK